MLSVTVPLPQAGLPCPSCLCFSITPLSSLFPQHLSIRTNHVTLTSVFTRVLRSGGISTAVGRGFLPIPRGRAQSPGWLGTPRCGVPSGLQKRPHLFRAARSAQGEAICGCSALSRGYKGEQKQEGAWRGGRTASWAWADGHRSGLVHPWVWTSIGAEWCRGRACSLMTMMTLRPSAQPLFYDPLVPTLWAPEDLLKRCTVDVTLTPPPAAHCPACLCTGSIPTLEDPSPGNTGQKLRPRQENGEGGSAAMGGFHPLLTSQNSLGSGHRLQAPRLSLPHRVSSQGLARRGARPPPPRAGCTGSTCPGVRDRRRDASRGFFQR